MDQGNTIAKAIDGNTTTFFDAPVGVDGWVGLDLGTADTITQVQYVPRSGFASRMVGGFFQGSSTADFSTGVITLFTITAAPASKMLTAQQVDTNGGFRYVRYLSPANGCCNVSELEFDGMPAAVIPLSTTFPNYVTWANGAPSPIVRAEAVGATVNGKVYVFGGFDNEGSDETTIPLSPRCDVYDPSTNTWTRLANFPEPFTHLQGVVVGNDIWFVGGYIGNHPGPGTLVYDDRIIVVGGETGYNDPQRFIVDYDPTTNTWGTSSACYRRHAAPWSREWCMGNYGQQSGCNDDDLDWIVVLNHRARIRAATYRAGAIKLIIL